MELTSKDMEKIATSPHHFTGAFKGIEAWFGDIEDEEIKDIKKENLEEVYILSSVNNETKTFIVKKISLPNNSPELLMGQIQYAYLKKISNLIDYRIMLKDLDKEEYINLNDNLDKQDKISEELITSISPNCSLRESFLANPEKVAEFNKNLDKKIEENSLKLYRGKKNADKMKPIV